MAVSHEISYGLLATSNGRIVSFLKSVHMVNYYWPKSRLVARSLIGCSLLKFVGSSIISFALGEGLLIASPRHLLSFVCAFTLVRSDSVEATQLARPMRHSVQFHLLLNLSAAIYKLRKLGFLAAAAPPVLGSLGTVLLGTAAFSAANFIMKLESLVLRVLESVLESWSIPLGSPPLRPSPIVPAASNTTSTAAADGSAASADSLPPPMAVPPLLLPEAAAVPPAEHAGGQKAASNGDSLPRARAAAPPDELRDSGPVEPPNMPKAMLQNCGLVATLVLGESCGQRDAAKLLVLLFLCWYYNKNLWYRGLLLIPSQSMLSAMQKPVPRTDAYPVVECLPLRPGTALALKSGRAKQD